MNQANNCRNCKQEIIQVKFCPNCGQKNTDGKISVAEFFSVFLSTVFNLESKLFQTMRDIFIPGKLTIEWFKGRHKPYFHPVRLFIVFALLLIAAITKSIGDLNSGASSYEKRAQKEIHRKEFATEINEFSKRFNTHPEKKRVLDSLVSSVSSKLRLSREEWALTAEKNNIKSKGKSIIELENELRTSMGDSAFQVVKNLTISSHKTNKDSIDLSNFNMMNLGSSAVQNIKISNEDFLNLPLDKIAEKYKIEGTMNKILFRQKIKLIKEQEGFFLFLLTNSLWIGLLMMPVFALLLKLLYFRRNYYFVEHLIFSFHIHSFCFLLFTVIILLSNYTDDWLFGITFLIILLYLYKAIKSVYGQGRLKSIIKLIIMTVIYFILFICFFIVGLFAGVFLF